MRPINVVATLLLVCGASAPGRLAAQDAPPAHISASIGMTQYDLSGTGLAPMFAVRVATPISSVLIFEGGMLATRPHQQFGETTTFLAPEAQVQLTLPFTRILPYMGLGAGAAFDLRSQSAGGVQSFSTISGSLGVRAAINSLIGLQVEFRARGVGVDFEGSSAEYTFGMTWRI